MFTLVRKFNRRTNRANHRCVVLLRTSKKVKDNDHQISIKQAAKNVGINDRFLATFYRKVTNYDLVSSITNIDMWYWKPRQIFNAEEELQLGNYLKKASDIYFGTRCFSKPTSNTSSIITCSVCCAFITFNICSVTTSNACSTSISKIYLLKAFKLCFIATSNKF